MVVIALRILTLGGAGEMGRAAVTSLASDDRVKEIVVADRDDLAARRVAHSVGAKASWLAVDVTDRQILADALRNCDVVVNTVGPFFRFGATVLLAAIDAGCDYIDICDDPQPTLEMLELDDLAKAAGITALVGMGASPGVSNLLAVVAARELDAVDSIYTCWNVAAAQPDSNHAGSTSAALVHGIRQISGEIPVIHGGQLVRRPALERLSIDYPGIGPRNGRSFGHPEAVTLSRAFPELRECQNVVFGDRATLAMLSALRWSIGHRLMSADGAARLAGRIERLTSTGNKLLQTGGVPPLFALATGTRRGQHAVVAAALTQLPGLSMAANTAVPLAVATPMVKLARRPGVHTPETLIDPGRFLDAFAGRCIGKPPPGSMLAITKSWASTAENAAVLNSHLLTALLQLQ
jgi:saccharopine dehydrogenase-like NADP-dependent oxidoreductase